MKKERKIQMKIAYLFPGQGSQFVGMGKDFYDEYEDARRIYSEAEKIVHKNIKELCFDATLEELTKTENAQLAISTTSLAILEVLKKYNLASDVDAGLSLGEYVALIHQNFISLEEGLQLLEKRSYLMANEMPKEQYGMAAVIGLDSTIIEKVCQKQNEEGKFVVPANYNYSGQTVVSGEVDAIQEVIEELKQNGAKKVIALNTSGPFHTIKLQKASQMYQEYLEKAHFTIHPEKVIKNLDGEFYRPSDNMPEILAKHIISPVRFDKTIQKMGQIGIDTYIEVGPGKALTGFIKKENKEAVTYHIGTVEELKNMLEELEK